MHKNTRASQFPPAGNAERDASGEWTGQEQDEHISTLEMEIILKIRIAFQDKGPRHHSDVKQLSYGDMSQ